MSQGADRRHADDRPHHLSLRKLADDPNAAGLRVSAICLALGFFNSLQFSSMNSMAYADIETNESSMASTIADSFQQMSMSFGLAFGSLVAAWYLGDFPQSRSPRGHHGTASRFCDLGRVDHRLLAVLLDAAHQGW